MKIGFTNGCYDILHLGHISLLNFCKSKCDYLVVGIDNDKMVKKSKGNDRPYNNENDRKTFLENIKSVDEVFVFNSHDHLVNKLKELNPDVMVVGSDYKDKVVVGSEHAKSLVFFEVIDGYSTTKILQNTSSG